MNDAEDDDTGPSEYLSIGDRPFHPRSDARRPVSIEWVPTRRTTTCRLPCSKRWDGRAIRDNRPMTLSDRALETFLDDYKRIRSLSVQASAYEIGQCCSIARKFIWPGDNLDKLRKHLGYADECHIEAEVVDTARVAAAALDKYHVLIPHLAILPLGPVRTYIALRHKPGEAVDVVQGTVSALLNLESYFKDPFVVVDSAWISRGDLISHFAYEMGILHWELTIKDVARQQKINLAGKLQFGAEMVGDLSFAWSGASVPVDKTEEHIKLSLTHEIKTLLLLQILHELVHSSSVAEMVVDVMKRQLQARP